MLDPFTEEETDEDDIGATPTTSPFIFNSLTSKVFRIVGLFMVVMGGTFFWLYSGGLGDILRLFLDRVPQNVLDEVAARNDIDPSGMDLGELIEAMDIVVALHPVEVLIFEAKVSALAGLVATLPVILFYAWPAAKERGLVYGDRRTFVVWGRFACRLRRRNLSRVFLSRQRSSRIWSRTRSATDGHLPPGSRASSGS